ncbi:hypothetical protein K7W42_02530 [Deinococcus sp. HMF7604]|uniref:hypothetical protein n=1 Tax=Deinococcus betulae TaxID=2873312 RepID=UPI001CD00C25|nr:hypothetical protein [Deinococcus betulae]MBZ9749735.1 hypothetical protein [Deinococcus betulae]
MTAPSPLLSAGPPVWNVARAAGLGPLTPAPAELHDQLADLRAALAGVLVAAAGHDLVFVGRSPEPLRAYLGGLLAGIRAPWTAHGLNVSLLGAELSPAQQVALRPLLEAAGLNPRRLAAQERRAALVDVVASGGTFAELHQALRTWAAAQGLPRQSVVRRVRVLGLECSGPARPGAQHWSDLPELRGVRTRSVLIAPELWRWLACDAALKVATRWPTGTWGHTADHLPERTPERLQALAQARALYLLGTAAAEREAMVAALNVAGGQQVPAVRALVQAWRGTRHSTAPRRNGRLPSPR